LGSASVGTASPNGPRELSPSWSGLAFLPTPSVVGRPKPSAPEGAPAGRRCSPPLSASGLRPNGAGMASASLRVADHEDQIVERGRLGHISGKLDRPRPHGVDVELGRIGPWFTERSSNE